MRADYLVTSYFLDDHTADYAAGLPDAWPLNDAGLAEGENTQQRVLLLYEQIADFVADTIRADKLPVSVAGDCVTTIAVLAGLQRAGVAPTLVWFDAHGDFNTWKTSPSGFLGGMPLAMMVGRGEQTLMEAMRADLLPEEKIILTDGRDLDAPEADALAAADILHLPDVADLLDRPLPDGPLYVHFDSDVLRLEDAPAMMYPAGGGPALETMRRVFAHLRDSGQPAAVSVTMPSPNLNGADKSRTAVLGLLSELVPDL